MILIEADGSKGGVARRTGETLNQGENEHPSGSQPVACLFDWEARNAIGDKKPTSNEPGRFAENTGSACPDCRLVSGRDFRRSRVICNCRRRDQASDEANRATVPRKHG